MEEESAFNELKHRLTIALDASQPLGIGAVLSRLQRNDTERVIAYGSRSLNEQEKNYCGTR